MQTETNDWPFPKQVVRHRNFYIALAWGSRRPSVTLLLEPELFPAAAASVFSLAYLSLTARDIPKLDARLSAPARVR